MLEILIHGSWVLWIIASCSIISLGIALERWRTMRTVDVDSEGLLNRLSEEIGRGAVDEAIGICDRTPGPVGDTLGTGLRRMQLLQRVGKAPEEIEDGIVSAMEERGLHVVNYLERNLTTLATVASLAPILGMLGTVTGMIKAFGNIKLMAVMSPAAVAGGIGEALWCTAGGLLVAAMATVEYNYFTARVNRFALQVQAAATKLVERLIHAQSTGSLTSAVAKGAKA
jgi:biopolymer transport protein ExbB